MNLRKLLARLGRRWYVVVAGLALTAGLCVLALRLVPTEYSATSSVLLLPPANTVGTGGNPYLSLGGLEGAVDVLSRAMTGEQTVDELTPPPTEVTYTFERDQTTSGPIILVQVKDSTAEGALDTLDRILRKAPVTLKALQVDVGAPEESMITFGVIATDVEATADHKALVRALIVVFAGGIGLTLLSAIVVDNWANRHGRISRKRQEELDSKDGRAGPRRQRPEPDGGSSPGREVSRRAGMRPPPEPTNVVRSGRTQ